MAFTSTDLTEIEAAIVALAKGERVVQVTLNGEEIQYNRTRLPELVALRDQIRGEVQQAVSGNTRHRYASTSKGY